MCFAAVSAPSQSVVQPGVGMSQTRLEFQWAMRGKCFQPWNRPDQTAIWCAGRDPRRHLTTRSQKTFECGCRILFSKDMSSVTQIRSFPKLKILVSDHVRWVLYFWFITGGMYFEEMLDFYTLMFFLCTHYPSQFTTYSKARVLLWSERQTRLLRLIIESDILKLIKAIYALLLFRVNGT